MNLTMTQIAEYISAQTKIQGEQVVCGYSIDSRTVQPGELFFAVRGERFDGHDFVASRSPPALRLRSSASLSQSLLAMSASFSWWRIRCGLCRLSPVRSGSFGAGR